MFTHLHVHTEYSLLDGMCQIPHLLRKAKELEMTSLAITDHGAMHGVIDFYLKAKEAGINPIVGCEVYVAPNSRQSRDTGAKNHYHLLLLARNQVGYRNLLQLTTKAHLEGFYYKPRVDKELLEQYHEGLIALSACTNGEIGRLILEQRLEEAKAAARWHKEVFGDYYLELQGHDIPELVQINRELVSMSRELDIPLVATNDVHYVEPDDAQSHDLLLCIQTNSTVYDEKRPRMSGETFYLKSHQEMASLFPELPEALENTARIAEMCQLDLEFGQLHLPEIELPEGKSSDDYLAELCQADRPRRYPQATPDIERRLAYELEVIRQTKFANYFLVVWDLVSFARNRNILLGVRGSAAASVVLYCLRVTEIDPLAYNLVFERFLNVERKEMPDIDLDFQDDRRDEVISYVANKYGHDHVAQIITFGTLGARAALRDVGRALGMSYGDVDRVARLVPPVRSTIQKTLEEIPEFRNAYDQDSAVRELVEAARKLEGISRHASTHAAGVVISKEPLTQYVPLQRPTRSDDQDIAMTQYAMDNIATIGLLKMDFLGLANLTILERAKEIIARSRGIEIDLNQIPLDDPKTFDLLSSGETTGVFQLEGAGMRRYIKQLKPSSFSDVSAMVALYRPGPMQHLPTFIAAKHGQEPIRYPHNTLSEILKETYGVIVYQDQVLLIVQAFAGYTLGEADIVRKAMGKKIPETMRKEKRRFIAGASKKGFSKELADEVWALIEPFAGYAFNKAHSVSYAVLAFQTAYLKANYPVEFMAALLTTYMGQTEKTASAVAECHRLGISVLPPDINRSEETFTLEKDQDGSLAVRFGLVAIKNVGASALNLLIAARKKGGAFQSIEDFCRRADLGGVNKRMLESLIKAGAMDSLGSRGALLVSVDRLLSLIQREQRLRESGQSTMFDLWGQSVNTPRPALELPDLETPTKEKLAWEKELLGVYLSEHPFNFVSQRLAKETITLCGQIDEEMAGQTVKIAGMVTAAHNRLTRDNRTFMSAVLEDLEGSIEVTAWPEVYERTRELWVEGNILLVTGKVKTRGDRVQVTCQSVVSYQPSAEEERESSPKETEEEPIPTDTLSPPQSPETEEKAPSPHQLLIKLTQTSDAEGDVTLLQEVVDTLKRYHGEDKVRFIVVQDDERVELEMEDLRVDCCPELHQHLARLLGEGAVVG